ncbi:MAG TPA: hypothetical protein VFQ61_28135 [Polyangiaceae bacterium]|nr:hypothetical protein [Polyangiaceae bacterium]
MHRHALCLAPPHSCLSKLLLAGALLTTLGALGCSSETDPPGGMGGSGGTGGAGGTGGSGGTGGAGALPILERPAQLAYDCSVSSPARLLDVPTNDTFTGGLATLGSNAFVAWAQAPKWDAPEQKQSVRFAPISGDAQLGAVSTAVEQTSEYFSNVLLVPGADGMTLLAMRQGERELLVGQVSADGTLRAPMKPVPRDGGAASRMLAVRADTGIALLWDELADGEGRRYDLKFGLLTDDGTLTVSPNAVATNSNWLWPAAITSTGQGFLVSYVENGWDGTNAFQVVSTRRIAADGTLGDEHELARSTHSDGGGSHALLWRGGEALLARSFTEGTYEGEKLGSTVLLTRLDADGRRLADDVRLQSWEKSRVNNQPFLFARGEDVGLLWSQGSYIYVCAGCMPDNHLEFVLLDGSTWAPKSNRLQFSNPAASGGLISPEGVTLGDDILVASRVGYHVTSELSAGTIRCLPR